MSIYPVRIRDWFGYDDDKHETMLSICPYLTCVLCGGPVTYEKGYAMHSTPYGGPHQAWCSEECLNYVES